jgi:hypothetical protein
MKFLGHWTYFFVEPAIVECALSTSFEENIMYVCTKNTKNIFPFCWCGYQSDIARVEFQYVGW